MDIPIIHSLMSINVEALVRIPTTRFVYVSWHERCLGYWRLNISLLIRSPCLVNSLLQSCVGSLKDNIKIFSSKILVFWKTDLFLLYIYECLAYMYVYLVNACVYRGEERVTDHLELELQMVAGHHLDTRRQIWVFCKSSKPLKTLTFLQALPYRFFPASTSVISTFYFLLTLDTNLIHLEVLGRR